MSTAVNERAFSLRTATKTVRRARLTSEHLNWCLHICMNTNGLPGLNVSGLVKRWRGAGTAERMIYSIIVSKLYNPDSRVRGELPE